LVLQWCCAVRWMLQWHCVLRSLQSINETRLLLLLHTQKVR
jgi:hypothetical protein